MIIGESFVKAGFKLAGNYDGWVASSAAPGSFFESRQWSSSGKSLQPELRLLNAQKMSV